MSDPFELGRITVTIQPPGCSKPLIVEQAVSQSVWADYFRPLPRDREVPWAPKATEEATNLRRWRLRLSEELGRQIAHSIREALAKQDPQLGYSPEEWEKITNPKRE